MTLPPHLRPEDGKPRRGRPMYRDPTANTAVSKVDKAPRRVPFSFPDPPTTSPPPTTPDHGIPWSSKETQ